MAEQRCRITMEVWCDPNKMIKEQDGQGLSALTDALERVADYWPGVQVVEPCYYERLNDQEIPDLEKALRYREEVPLVEGTPLLVPFRIPRTGETVRVFGKAIGKAAGAYEVVDSEPIKIEEDGRYRSYNLTLKKKEDA